MPPGNEPSEPFDFARRVEAVRDRIAKAAVRNGRTAADITLVAVSKKFSAAHIQAAYQAGLREFGENYVQEFAAKRNALALIPEARFHLIGHLQSNKAKQAYELFDVIQTADSARLLERLNAVAENRGRQKEVLLEVKLSDEESKTGAPAAAVAELVRDAPRWPNLHITGLMTVPPWSEDPEESRPYFQKLAELAKENGLAKLSMGMSADLDVAIEEGATIVRVGTALFGKRPKPGGEAPLTTDV